MNSGNLRMRRSDSNASSQSGWQTSARPKVASAVAKARRTDLEEKHSSPVEELPETSFDSSDDTSAQYLSDGKRQRKAYLLSPYGATSQVTLSPDEMGNLRGDPTVRLVNGKPYPRGRSASVSDGHNSERSRRYSSSSDDSRRSSLESGRLKHVSVNEVVSAYSEERKDGLCAVQGSAEGRSPSISPSSSVEKVQHEHPELSWTMTFILLTSVTVVRIAF